MIRWRGIIEEYRKFLPVTAQTPVITLGEGHTPLIRAARLAKKIAPGIDLYLKYEGMNPTGSFKDRGMTMAISKAVEAGARAVICASTGNTSASAAAYGARAGIAVYVLIPAGKIALGKLSQAMMHQATVIQVEGNFDQALTIVKELSATYPVELVNSLNPFRIEGQKTAAMEICDDLGDAPAENIVRSAVDDAVDRLDIVRSQSFHQCANDRNPSAHARLEAEIDALPRRRGKNLFTMHGQQGFVGRDYVFAPLDSIQDHALGKVIAAHQLNDDIHPWIREDLLDIRREHARRNRNAAVARDVQVCNANQRDGHAHPPTNQFSILDQHPSHTGADRSKSD
jgi:cysteine synthase